ncbi:SusC/RagA family TonB-linked outer membrane protein [Thermophagus xiamenensis]|uniref:TonB-linked outer membrane protein, SusC/RagA family n=1 Tax=Thermophagus xiamenensis TaxID=385682 RepID=A0A1I2FER4_9BACT|nr:TonB-dependent receptor [Thermophagus xiamenensis]SFF03237.1 TonB-linked outer membrane protein, SusC/RagA family [Thermophagus xiamenensis]
MKRKKEWPISKMSSKVKRSKFVKISLLLLMSGSIHLNADNSQDKSFPDENIKRNKKSVSLETFSFYQQNEKIITGKVTDENGDPIPGATIQVKGTNTGTISDMNGNYTISIPSDAETLVFSFVGMETQEIIIGTQSRLDVSLNPEVVGLDEVVVIGYGTQRKGDVTSAVASVKSEDFIQGKIQDAAELVKGKIAGLSITKTSGDPNATSSIMLRGITTIMGSVSPLVLVDGIEGSLTTVAPENIESIDVLKDASASAIYGTRGANGVILITTKSGKRGVQTSASYTSYLSFSQWYKTPDFMDTHDIIYGRTQFEYEGYDTDWLKAVTRKAGYTQNHSLSLEGGSESSTYAANVTYSDEEGIMRKSDRNDIRAQLDFNQYAMNDILKFNFNILYSTHKNTNNNNAYVYRQALIHNPSSPVYNEDGSYYEDFNLFQYYNPVAIQNELIGDTRSHFARIVGNVTFEPIKGWQTNLMLSRKETESTSQNYYTSSYFTQATAQIRGTATKGSSNSRSDNLELTSKYNFSINKSRFSTLIGYSYLYNLYDGFGAGNSEFPSESYLYNNLGQGLYLTDEDHTASMSSYKNDNKLIGFFGRVSYGYDNRYNALVSVRHEGSSKFGENHKWGTFPSVSLGWTISNESFMQNISWLDNLKLRSGYGVTGIIPNSSYMSLTMFDYDAYGKHLSKDGEWTPSLKVAQNPNPDLKWEKTSEINIGIDWSILHARLSGTIDVYSKKTVDLLYDYAVPVPPNMYGYTTANVGKMRNRGIEVMISALPVETKDFEWNTTLTLSHNENKLLSLSNDLYETDNFMEVGGVSDPISVPTHCMEVGHRLGDFWGLKSVGVSKDGFVWVEVSDGNGGWEVKEFDTSYNEEANRQRLGNGLPQVYAGWNNSFRYKNFDLNLQFTGQFGFKILNVQRSFYENNSIAYNRLKSAADLHPAVDASGAPVLDEETGKQLMVSLSSSMSQGVWSDHIEDGDFVKLTNATLGYTFPISGKANEYIKNLRVYVSGQNLFCITGYSGLDPEVSNYFLAPGIDDRDKYPTVRSFTFGLSVNF